jgi:hypothetical protein
MTLKRSTSGWCLSKVQSEHARLLREKGLLVPEPRAAPVELLS